MRTTHGNRSHGMAARRVAVAVALVAVAVVAGCSKVGTDGADVVDEESLSPKLASILKEGYAGAYTEPTADGPAAVPGKKVWVISCGQSSAACVLLTSEFEQAGAALGWQVKAVDGKADPATTSRAINQAVAAGAEGIVITGMDCAAVKSALRNAREAGIPVVSRTSYDCNQGGGKGEPLFTAQLNDNGRTDPGEILRAYGAARADFLAAKLGGKGTIVSLEETSYLASQAANQGFHERLEEVCPNCKVEVVEWTFSQIGKSAAQTWQSALLKNPNADALSFPYDSMMPQGLQAALKQVNFQGIVAGGEGLNLDLVRSGEQTTEVAFLYALQSWGLASSLNRIFAGEDPATLPSEGGGFVFVDASHNLPADESIKIFPPPFDFRAMYTQMWTGS